MEYVITAAVLLGFGYFIYTRIQATKGRKPGGVGSGPKGPPRPEA